MAEIFSTSFEGSGIESGWAQNVGNGCTLDWDNTEPPRPPSGGAEVLKFISASTGFSSYAYKNLGSGNGEAKSFTRGYFRISAEDLVNQSYKIIMWGANQSGDTVWEVILYQHTDSKLYWITRIYNNGGYVFGAQLSPEVSLGIWYCLEFKYDDVANEWAFRCDGVEVESNSLTGTHYTEIRYFCFGPPNIQTDKTLTGYCDLAAADDADWVGEIEVYERAMAGSFPAMAGSMVRKLMPKRQLAGSI